MTVLVFLTASAWAWVVATHFLFNSNRLGDLSLLRVAIGLRQEIVALLAQLRPIHSLGLMLTHIIRVLYRNVGQHQERYDILVDFLDHSLEEVERLEFVNHQRVFLLV